MTCHLGEKSKSKQIRCNNIFYQHFGVVWRDCDCWLLLDCCVGKVQKKKKRRKKRSDFETFTLKMNRRGSSREPVALLCISHGRQRRVTSAAQAAPSPLPHDAVMQLVLLLDVGMLGAGPLAAFAVVAAEDGGQLLLGQPVGRQRDGALLRQAPAVLRAQEGTG